MKFFIDTADVREIEDLAASGLVDGVTTNPSLIAKSGRNFLEVVREICAIVPGPVSAEVAAIDVEGMLAEGRHLARIAGNVCVKLPLTWEGLHACKAFSRDGIATNVTLCFTAGQALLAAKAGATFVSPFIGRLDDIGHDGMGLIADIVEMYGQYPDTIRTQVLVASVRSAAHVTDAARLGAHVATLPPKILRDLVKHPLTDKGLAGFLKDWEGTGQKIV
jgi:transaldolase